jgi:hypothetical protein
LILKVPVTVRFLFKTTHVKTTPIRTPTIVELMTIATIAPVVILISFPSAKTIVLKVLALNNISLNKYFILRHNHIRVTQTVHDSENTHVLKKICD